MSQHDQSFRDRYIIKRQGKDFVLYAGLVAKAHDSGLRSLTVEPVELPSESNGQRAVFLATASMDDPENVHEGRIFTDVGDASPENVSRNIAPHLIRMASTRAKARALRDALNISETALEELSEDQHEQQPQRQEPQRGKPREHPANREEEPAKGAEKPENGQPPQVEGWSTPGGGGASVPQYDSPVWKAQLHVLEQLLVKRAGEKGEDYDDIRDSMERYIQKPIAELTYGEADSWINFLVEKHGDIGGEVNASAT